MTPYIIIIVAAVILGSVFLFKAFTSWGNRWGATAEECARRMTGDAYLDGGPPARVAMTRAISLKQPPEVAWPWLAQLGRGAGWYSYDLLDNGNKASARHLVSWIPEPQLGDASAIGYLRFLDPGRELVWWVGGEQFLGAKGRMLIDILVTPEDRGSRLVIRISADAAGPIARPAIWFFQVIDTMMARRQLLGIKERVETCGVRAADPEHPENGRPDQYQFYETIYASGQSAGVPGREKAALWRQMAIEDKVLVGNE
ncbi:MAG: hypothetical protein AB1424_09890 [Thermodesulfobacteriota bacterium]